MRLNSNTAFTRWWWLAAASAFALAAAWLLHRPAEAVITLDATTRFQTFKGWEAAITATAKDDYLDDLAVYDHLFPQAADLGITRIRVGLFSGTESRSGFGARYMAGQMTERELVSEHAYNIVNDNDDPNVADPAGFDFTILDWEMDHLVVPYKRHVEARGQPLYVYLNYVDRNASPFRHIDHPEEYGEFMAAVFDHLHDRYGFVPDGIDTINEPDHMTVASGTAMGRMVVAAASRLAAHGFHPEFLGPAVVDRAHAVPYFDEMMAVPGAAAHLTNLSFHCYRDSDGDSLPAIGARAAGAGIGAVQNECWDASNTYQQLHRDLKVGYVAAWQDGTFGAYYALDRATGTASPQERTKIKQQYYRYVRPGAVRIGAATTDGALDPLAFVDPAGGTVVVVLATRAGTARLVNLPPGRYQVTYATRAAFDVHLPDLVVTGGEPVAVTMPDAGVFTVAAQAP